MHTHTHTHTYIYHMVLSVTLGFMQSAIVQWLLIAWNPGSQTVPCNIYIYIYIYIYMLYRYCRIWSSINSPSNLVRTINHFYIYIYIYIKLSNKVRRVYALMSLPHLLFPAYYTYSYYYLYKNHSSKLTAISWGIFHMDSIYMFYFLTIKNDTFSITFFLSLAQFFFLIFMYFSFSKSVTKIVY